MGFSRARVFENSFSYQREAGCLAVHEASYHVTLRLPDGPAEGVARMIDNKIQFHSFNNVTYLPSKDEMFADGSRFVRANR